MSTLSNDVLGSDLDFLIAETGQDFIGVTPAGIADKVFTGCLNSMAEGYDVMLSGNEVTLDANIVLNGNAYATLPTKGALLKDRAGSFYKVFDVVNEDVGPGYRLNVLSRYQRS